MTLCDHVRAGCAEIAAHAQWVSIDLGALGRIEPGPPPQLDPDCHYLDGPPRDVAAYLLCLDAINFGSGWFPLLHKRAGHSGYTTVASALADRWRADGPWSNGQLRAMSTREVATTLEQPADLELMALYAQALRALGCWLGERDALGVAAEAGRSAERFAELLARGMAMFHDAGFYKRAQIAAADLALAGLADFRDLGRLTIFADNVVPHVLHCDGVLVYDERLAARIEEGRTLPLGGAEREIRACAVHACELIAARLGVEPRTLDNWLWTRGREPRYKERPRHRCRCVYY
jgi:hypothetical protein